MKTLFLAVFVAAAIAAPARAQDSSSTAAAGTSAKKESKSSGSAHAQVGERAPGDASSSTSAEGRPRAGIEVGTASATQGGRTDNGTPPRHAGATERPATAPDQTDAANNSANRAADHIAFLPTPRLPLVAFAGVLRAGGLSTARGAAGRLVGFLRHLVR